MDIRTALGSSASRTISLHSEGGQKRDIADYVRSLVYSDCVVHRWSKEEKEMVLDAISEKADGG
jgi:hypothetical protein